MAHLIMEHDKGAVFGTTWHKMAQYKQLGDYVTREEMREIADYPMELSPHFVVINGNTVPSGHRAIVRPDIGLPIVESVGDDFCLENNLYLVEHIESNFLDGLGNQVGIESVGTLRNGASFFINLRVREFQVTGDKSKSVSNLMFVNPLGKGSYKCGAHNVRIVCNNTLRAAEAQAAANGSLFCIRHTKGAVVQIPNVLEQMAEFQLGLDTHILKLNRLAERQICTAEAKAFLEAMFPMPMDGQVSEIKKLHVWDAREAVLSQFEGDQELAGGTAYGMLNAFTYTVDHREPSSKSDEAQVAWDNLYGKQASQKEKAFETLLALV
jgi:phage/plasmid-like protein (TIGR03299 family)